MGTLYIVGAPAGEPDDITLRARRILEEVDLVVAENAARARHLLAHYEISTPLVAATADGDPLDALERGDVAILSAGQSPVLAASCQALVQAAIERGLPIVPIPGPSLPIAALVISGLPADSFVHLGQLPQSPAARRDLLASVAAERRTLIARESSRRLSETLGDLAGLLGNRPLVLVTTSDEGIEIAWRGTTAAEIENLPELLDGATRILVVGGAQKQAARWEEERLRAALQAGLEQGLGAKETSRRLAAESGWSRREIYRLAAEASAVKADGHKKQGG